MTATLVFCLGPLVVGGIALAVGAAVGRARRPRLPDPDTLLEPTGPRRRRGLGWRAGRR